MGPTHVDKHQTVKVLVRLSDKSTVGLVDTGVAVVCRGVSLGLNTLGGVLLETLDRETLERSQGPSASLNGVGRSHKVGSRVGDVGGRVRVLQGLLAGVDRPGSDAKDC